MFWFDYNLPNFFDVKPPKPYEEMTEEECDAFLEAHEMLKDDATLRGMFADLQRIPGAVAACISNDRSGIIILVQFEDETFKKQNESSFDEIMSEPVPVHCDLNLPEELQLLRQDGTILRGPGNHNISAAHGYEGRLTTVYLIAKTAEGTIEGEWVIYQQQLIGGVYPNNTMNRLLRVPYETESYTKLV